MATPRIQQLRSLAIDLARLQPGRWITAMGLARRCHADYDEMAMVMSDLVFDEIFRIRLAIGCHHCNQWNQYDFFQDSFADGIPACIYCNAAPECHRYSQEIHYQFVKR